MAKVFRGPICRLAFNFPRVQGASDAQARTVHDVGVDLRGRHINMPKQILHGANVRPALEQMSGKTVAQRVQHVHGIWGAGV